MKRIIKKIFTLDFGNEFLLSFLKLLFFWNPLWTLLVSLVWGDWHLSLFLWAWSLLEATLVVLFAMAMMKIYLLFEGIWARGKQQSGPNHGVGWYLLLLAFIVPPGIFLASRLMVAGINYYFAGDPIPGTFQWKYYGNAIFLGWLFLLALFLLKNWQDLRDAARQSLLRAEELEKERLQALLTKLKDQMNPHFLFNTLNTVAALIPADPSKAEKVVVKLSALYQGILSAASKTSHSLQEELEFCRNYLDIEQVRFGSRLSAEFEVGEGFEPAKVQVPVLLLQPMVENAVKHGLSPRASGGRIWIRAGLQNGYLAVTVEDDGVGFGQSPYKGSGTALENTRKRLELGYGPEGILEISSRDGGGTIITLRMPFHSPELINREAK